MTMPNAQSAVSRAFDSPDIRQAVADLRLRLADGSRLLLGVAANFLNPIDGTPLRQRKGAPDTFDVGGYFSLLQRLARRDEDVVYAPDFRRSIDEPVAASIAVPASVPLIITEGNYLLAENPAWQRVRSQLDAVWFIDTPPALRLSRLVERHMVFGMDRPAAEAWANGSDEANARLIEATRDRADRVILWR